MVFTHAALALVGGPKVSESIHVDSVQLVYKLRSPVGVQTVGVQTVGFGR